MAKKKAKKRSGSATCQKVSSYKRKGKKVSSYGRKRRGK